MCEGISGFHYLNGFSGQVPVRLNLGMWDTLAGIHGARGIMIALRQRDQRGQGQVVDVGLFETTFNIILALED